MPSALIVSDTHLSPAAPLADEQWQVVVDAAAGLDVELVIHVGDISADGFEHPDELDHARTLLDELPVPWVAVPGNHDVGPSERSNPERRRRFEHALGERYWTSNVGGRRLVGIDIEELTAAGGEVEDRLAWLDEQLGSGAGPVTVVQHRPLHPLSPQEEDRPTRYVVQPVRTRLAELYDRHGVDLIVSGHVHQWRCVDDGRRTHLWCPTTWATMPDSFQPTLGTKAVGVVQLDCEPDDAAGVTAELVTLDGLVDAVIGETFPYPFRPRADRN